ncbi:MAG: hypothetical protein AAGA81_17190, partial [Acidobacteriota bacterium]
RQTSTVTMLLAALVVACAGPISSDEEWYVATDSTIYITRGKPSVREGCVEINADLTVCGDFEIYSRAEAERRRTQLEAEP